MQKHKPWIFRHLIQLGLILMTLNLFGCGNKSDLYMPGNSPEDKIINKTKEHVKSNDIISPGKKNEEANSKYYEKETRAPLIESQKSKTETEVN